MIPPRAPETPAAIQAYLAAFTNFETALPLPADRRALGPERARRLLDRLELRPASAPVIQVAGSKGKGSTVYWLEALLLERGAKPGAYLSPHLEKLNERIRVGGAEVADEDLLRGLARIHPHLLALERGAPDELPTFFDLWTALALLLFREAGCSHILLEVGLGGPLDSTSAIEHDVGVLTTVDLEHRELLGNTESEIAAEKSKIARRGAPFVIQETDEAWCDAARRAAVGRGARCLAPAAGIDRSLLESLSLPQRANLATAVAALEALPEMRKYERAEIAGALQRVALPARLEILRGPPALLLDSAHTPKSFEHFARHLAAWSAGRPATLLVAFLRGKEWQESIARALPYAGRWEWIVTRAPSPRALAAVEIAAFLAERKLPVHVEESTTSALRLLQVRAEQGTALAVSGSFYLAGAARAFWRALN